MTALRKQILIIDDQPSNLLTFGAALSDEFRLKIATSGEAGLRLAEKSPPDLVSLDIMMPGIDGYETCRRFKESPSLQTIPIIFITAMTEAEVGIAGLEVGAADYITKPFNIRLARQRIHALLERETLRKEVASYHKHLADLAAGQVDSHSLKDRLPIAPITIPLPASPHGNC